MITFKAIVISNNRRKDGTYPVKIRVTYKGVSRRLATTLVCTPADLTRSLKIKNPDILNKSDELIGRMRNVVKDISPFDLEAQNVDWVVKRIKDVNSKENFHLDFFQWADGFLLSKTPSTRKSYNTALNSFARFLGKREIDINSINKMMLQEYVDRLENENALHTSRTSRMKTLDKKKKKGTSNFYIILLGHLYNAARDRFNDEDSEIIRIPKQPFSKMNKIAATTNGQKSIGFETMQKIISADVQDANTRTALDMFIVSFGLMGANMVDLWNAKTFSGKTWIYNRQKTKDRRSDHAEMRVEIQPELQPCLDRLKGKGGWWLNVLHGYASNKDCAAYKVNKYLKRWCVQNGLEPFTFYAARHTFATLARTKCGVDKSTIDDCLAHVGSFQITDIYAEKAWNLMQDANRKVIGLFEWGVTEK